MIAGIVSADGAPIVDLILDGRTWVAVVDTGFNGYLELPDSLRAALNPRYLWESTSILAAGQSVMEELFEVVVPFDGQTVTAEVTFVPGNQILVGTALLAKHELTINFKARTVRIERVP